MKSAARCAWLAAVKLARLSALNRSHDDSPPLPPFAAPTANGCRPVERDDNLDLVVRVRWHDSLGSTDDKEAAVPQVPVRQTGPAGRLILQRLVQCFPPFLQRHTHFCTAVSYSSRFVQELRPDRSIFEKVVGDIF
jgi:hypothetical protein